MTSKRPILLLLVLSVALPGARALADEAERAYRAGEASRAAQLWKVRALRHRDRGASWMIGVMLERGEGGLEADPAHAAEWYRRAARGDRADARFYRALAHAHGKGGHPRDADAAERWLTAAAKAGVPEIQTRVAQCYLGEHFPDCGVLPDARRALVLLRTASASGYPEADCVLAGMYERGAGVDADAAEARRRLDLAAASGHTCGNHGSAREILARAAVPAPGAGPLAPPTGVDVASAPPPLSRGDDAATGTAAPVAALPGGYGRHRALVIGNDAYTDLPRLRSASRDARAVARLLEQEYGFSTDVLIDATRGDVIGALARLRHDLEPTDNLLIYYAGHGWLDRDAEQGYWLPVDARKDDPSNWISNADVSSQLRAMGAKHAMVVSDSCYAGTLTRGIRMDPRSGDRYLEKMARLRTRVALSSGGLEPVVDAGSNGHSVFANAFMDALRRNPGVLEGYRLFLDVRRPVALESTQTPEYGDIRFADHRGGDFLFVRREAADQ